MVAGIFLLAGCAVQGASGVSFLSGCQPPREQFVAKPSAPTPPKQIERNPLSGRPGPSEVEVLAIKVDNDPRSRSHTGLQAADLIYLHEIEGGLTRMTALYSSEFPAEVAPVRSARITDIDLLKQFKMPAFGFSGAHPDFWPSIRAAELIDVSAWAGQTGWGKAADRLTPLNLAANTKALLERAQGTGRTAKTSNINFTFDDKPMTLGVPVEKVSVKYPSTTFEAEWGALKKGWKIGFDGKPDVDTATGVDVLASTVIVQVVKQSGSRYRDVNDRVTPLQETVGTGEALILRDGRGIWGTWEREKGTRGTKFFANGERVPLAPGHIWVALTDSRDDVTTR
jgi:hypothetical protein